MFTMTRNKIRLSLLLLAGALVVVAAIPRLAIGRPVLQIGGPALGMVCTEDPAAGSSTFDLQATDGYIQMPDGNSLYMWGFAPDVAGAFQIPGPVLCVNEGDAVTINLNNDLSVPTSIIFPGQMGVTPSGGAPGLLTNEAAAGGTVSYSFVAGDPGTYLYESGTEAHLQVQMGLYGTLVVRPAMGANFAYNDLGTEFADEYLLVMHEIDPVIHQAVERGDPVDFTARHDRYWTLNGRAAVDTFNNNFLLWMPNQPYGALVRVEADAPIPALVRYANAGSVNHPFHPHGNNMRVVGRDGRPLQNAAFENFTTTLGGGQTYDLLFRWDSADEWATNPAEPVPVSLPGINDVVYKDGVTFFSGAPRLGEQGTLPVGVTSYNECGEFYFPWHSHALNEIQNFDEGFGGMLTVVRVDPPGGCP